jgi:hypothetical protein
LESYDPLGIRFIDESTGEVITGDLQTSFHANYAKRYYAKFQALEDGVAEKFDNPTTVLLTFSASNRDEERNYVPPVDHLEQIRRAWRDNNRQQLRYVLEEKMNIDPDDWAYGSIVEPHKSGYGHLHVAVFIDGDVDPELFESVMETHVRHCPLAGPEAHRYDPNNPEDSAISVNKNSEINNLGSYLAEYLGPGMFEDPFDMPEYVKRFCAMAWASGIRRVRFSKKAQELMKIGEEDYNESSRSNAEQDGAEDSTYIHDGTGIVNAPETDYSRAELVIENPDGDDEIIQLDGGTVNWVTINRPWFDHPPDTELDESYSRTVAPPPG